MSYSFGRKSLLGHLDLRETEALSCCINGTSLEEVILQRKGAIDEGEDGRTRRDVENSNGKVMHLNIAHCKGVCLKAGST